MGDLWQDIRFGLRMMAQSPGFTAVAVLTLALGIGANAAIFSILDPLLLRNLPVSRPDELVLVHAAGSLQTIDSSEPQTFITYRDKSQVFSGVAGFTGMSEYVITRDGRTSSAHGESVSGNYFDLLGIHPYLGRYLTLEDERAESGKPVVVLSFDYWKRAFNSDPAVVGTAIPLRNLLYTIVGVAQPEFFGAMVGEAPDFYLPLGSPLRRDDWVAIVARLKPGISIIQAQSALEPLFQQIMQESLLPPIEKQQDMARLLLTPAGRGLSDLREKFSLPARILMAVVGLVLLIACSNVANLLFARGTARKKEITVRLALGAGRGRLVRQLVTESALLAVMGTAIGLLAASWASNLLVASLSTQHLHIALSAGMSVRVLLFTAGALVLTVFLCGVTSALSATRGDLAQGLKIKGTDAVRTGARSWLVQAPVTIQVALSVTLLAGAGLLLHSLINLETFDVGFDRDHVLAVSFNGSAAGRTPQQAANFYDQIVEQAKSLPGVRSASISVIAPVDSGRMIGVNVVVEGYALQTGEEPHVFMSPVSSTYFETLGIPLLAGRDFAATDNTNSPRVAIINQAMARHYFGNQSPVGRRFRFVEGNGPPMEIIGVVADSKYNDLREATPDFLYLDLMQSPSLRTLSSVHGILEVRSAGKATLLAGPLRNMIQSLDSTVQITGMKTLRVQIDESLHQDRLIAALCGTFSLLALVLTCVGLYGMLSFGVARRTSEIGLRVALGADRSNIFRLVIGQGMKPVAAGLLIGLAGALASVSLLTKLLFGVKGTDPITFAGVSALLIGAAVAACYLPARRAMRVDPLVALRHE